MAEGTKTNEILKCLLTDKEKMALGETMSICLSNIRTAEAELDSVKKQFASKIATYKAELTEAANLYQTTFEMRTVECTTVKDYQTGTVFTTRLDTGEIIRERAMGAEERQGELFEEKEAPAGEGTVQPPEPGLEGTEATPGPPTESASEAEAVPF